MNRIIILFTFIGILTACGGGSDNAAPTSAVPDNSLPGADSSWPSFSVVSASDLPACNSDRAGQLWYIENDDEFQVCKTSGWASISVGNSISSNRIINPYFTDMCTQYTGESCVFTGGQVVKYTDGSILLLGGYDFLYTSSSGDLDSDTNSNAVTIIIPPEVDEVYMLLSYLVARGSGYNSMWLYYTRSPESVVLLYDSNGNGIAELGTDTVITTLNITSW